MSAALHAATGAVLFLALARLTGAAWPSALAAAAFTLHPLRVESVAWAAERKDVLSGLFFALTLLAYERYARAPSRRRYLVVAAALALGLLAKPMLVTVPCVLLLLDVWPLRRVRPEGPYSFAALIREKIPLFALALASSVATFEAQKEARGGNAVLPVSARLENAAVGYATYLVQTVYPVDLAVFYPHPALFGAGHSGRVVVVSAALLLAITGLVLRARHTHPYLAVGWFWYLGMLVPVIGLIQVGGQAHADRYTYLPQIGLFLAAIWGCRLTEWRGEPVRRAAAVGCLVALAALSWREVGYWRDNETLFRVALEAAGPSHVAHTHLGIAYMDRENYREARDQFRAALVCDSQCRVAQDGLVGTNLILGSRALRAGDSHLAETLCREVLQYQPDSTTAMNNLAAALLKSGKREEAESLLVRVLTLDPYNRHAKGNLALLRGGNNR
jgi:tetratricopeptide (TPR) repeat protein